MKMRVPALCLFGLPLLSLVSGCQFPTANGSGVNAVSNLSGNWQFETGSSIGAGSAPFFMAGSLVQSGSVITGTMGTFGLCQSNPGAPTTVTGTYNATTGELVVFAPPATGAITADITLGSSLTTTAAGHMSGSGQLCALVADPGPAVGVQIPALTGTFIGSATGSSTATANLTVTQSASPNAAGQFPLSGTLQFTAGSCTANIPVSGAIAGAPYSLASSTGTTASISGLDNVGGATLPAVTITFPNGPCNTGSAATFTTTLVRQ